MQEAILRHAPLTIMTVLPGQVRPATMSYWGLRSFPDDSGTQDEVRKAVQRFVDEVASEIGSTVPEVTVSVARGNPAEELLKASGDADMLIVGSRGNGGFGRLLLGSVSSQVTHHAQCPVVVIPGTHEAA
jgi:nucleotide-binding universal stress UspA family protein